MQMRCKRVELGGHVIHARRGMGLPGAECGANQRGQRGKRAGGVVNGLIDVQGWRQPRNGGRSRGCCDNDRDIDDWCREREP